MFKTVALMGFLAGGAAFGISQYTDLLCCHGDDCPLSGRSCCNGEPAATVSPCCQHGDESGDPNTLCSAGEAVVAGAVGPKTLSCCALKPCCEGGGTDCCVGDSAGVAVAGPAGLFAKATK